MRSKFVDWLENYVIDSAEVVFTIVLALAAIPIVIILFPFWLIRRIMK